MSGAEQLVPPAGSDESIAALVMMLSRGFTTTSTALLSNGRTPPRGLVRRTVAAISAATSMQRTCRGCALAEARDRRVHRAGNIRADPHATAPSSTSLAHRRHVLGCDFHRILQRVAHFGGHIRLRLLARHHQLVRENPRPADRFAIAQPIATIRLVAAWLSNTPCRANVLRFIRVICQGAFFAICFQCSLFELQAREHLERNIGNLVRSGRS